MISLRAIRMPVEHLNAEVLAAPLASPSAFEMPLLRLDPALGWQSRQTRPTAPSPTKELWRATEKLLASTFPSTSVDELITRRDTIWFGPNPNGKPRRMHEYLREATEHLLSRSNPNPLFHNASRSDADLRNEWRWARFALPTDLLIVAMGMQGIPASQLSPVLIANLKDKGFAESHLHLKAAIDFPLLWESLQKVLYESAKEDMFAGPGADFEEGSEFASWLLRVAVVRLILARFLKLHKQYASFQDYLSTFLQQTAQVSVSATATLNIVISDLLTGSLSEGVSFASVHHLYVFLTQGYWHNSKPNDPISESCKRDDDLGYEFTFMTDAFAYFDANSDELFESIFWQCQRIRVRFYRHIVQRPMTPGLQFFTRTYSRMSSARKPIKTADFVKSAIRLAGPGLTSLEARVIPENNILENLEFVQKFDKAACGQYEAGLVYHFSKSRGKAYEEGRPGAWGEASNESPERNSTGYRFSDKYRDYRREAMALSGLLCTYPGMLARIRGVDFCTDELSIPTWVLKPAFEYFHQASERASQYLKSQGFSVQRARSTAHVGEDFVHLLGGLRRISEAVEFLGLADGDRLGHALALGHDSRQWSSAVPSVPMTRGERLFDLIWARRTVLKHGISSLSSQLPLIESEILEIAVGIFPRPISLADLNQLFEDLHETKALVAVGFPGNRQPAANLPPSLTLLWEWLCDQAVFRQSAKIKSVSTDSDVCLTNGLQAWLRSRIGQAGIVIEVNPTSNLLVGNLCDIAHHPLWNLSSPDPNKRQSALRICIGSDDPMTFATSLPEEFQLLADSITKAGYSSQDADRWIEEVRDSGMSSRFTVGITLPEAAKCAVSQLVCAPMMP